MKRLLSTLLALALVVGLLPPMRVYADAGLIHGTRDGNVYTWNFGEASGKNTFNYSDDYASIRIGLGEKDRLGQGTGVDTLSGNAITFVGPSCMETNDTNGLKNADETNRYILITPNYSGTISFSIAFTFSSNEGTGSANGRVGLYTFDDANAVDLTQLVKIEQNDTDHNLGNFSSSTGSSRTVTFSVEKGKTYSLHTYNVRSTISNLQFTSTEFPSGGTTDPEPEPPVSSSATSFDFDSGSNSEWTGATFVTGGRTGNAMQVASGSTATTTVTGIAQGSYTVTMWVKNSTASGRLTLSNTGGPDSIVKMTASSDWVQIAHRNVLVYNGQMTLEVASSGSALLVDDIEITLDSNDNNPVTNWGFENGLTGWTTSKGTATIVTTGADTGSNAVRLADQSEISQKITVKPDTDYIATVRMKVDVEDTYKSTNQTLDGNVLGVFVERTSTGNRVNLGVRGTDSTVLRQAPSATADYSLVTIAFHTGANQTEVELFANTVYDDNYKESVTVYENTYGTENPFPGGYQRPNPNKTDTTKLADNWTSNGSNYAYVDNFDVFEIDNSYIKGADMSFLPVIEDCGGKYFANGVQQDALRILSNHGVNSITTMLFVHSGNEVYDWTTLEWMTPISKDYDGNEVSFRKQVEGYFDKTHSIKMAQRAQELGMTYMPGFHYSDTWISAAKAHMPYEWFEQDYEGNISNGDIQMLTTAVYNYVYDILDGMEKAGVTNIIAVKNGNEQDGGLVFPVAMGSKFEEHAAIMSASAAAVHDVYPGAINLIHSNSGHDTTRLNQFFTAYANRGADYDGMALSLYAGRETTSQFAMMLGAFSEGDLKYRDYINVETGMTLTTSSPIGDTESTMTLSKYYDTSPTGQYNYLLMYMQAPLDIPNPYGVMRGFYYWNAEAIAVFGAGHKVGISVDASKRTLFNNGTASIKAMGSNQDGKMGDMSAGVYAYLHRGQTKAVSDSIYTPLQYSGVNYAKGTAESISLEGISLAVGERARLHPVVAPTNQVLDDYSVEYSSDKPDVAEVSPYGFVIGKSAGTATITATIGTVSTTATVTVGADTKASGITVNYDVVRDGKSVDSGTVAAGTPIQARPYDKVKFTASLAGNPTDTAVVYTMTADEGVAKWFGDTWQTDDTTMRSMTQTLSTKNFQPIVQLDPKKDGTVEITAKSADGNTTLTFQVVVNTEAVTAVEIVEGNSSVQAGKTLQLTAKLTPEDATLYKVKWSSSQEDIATVDENGLVTGIKPGTTTITVTSEAYPNVSGSIELTVTEVLVEEVLLSRETLYLTPNTSAKLTATVAPDNAVDKSIEWSVTEGQNVVTVGQDGTVTAKAVGTATVTATNTKSGKSAVCTVTVQASAVAATGMELSEKEVWLKSNYFSPTEEGRGDKPIYKLEAVLQPENATYTEILWESSNNEIASVKDGIITAHKAGMVTITAKVNNGALSATATVYVPSVSEDWENYELGTTGGFVSNDNKFTNTVITDKDGNKALQAVGSGSYDWNNGTFDRLSFNAVGGELVVVDFDWNVGTVNNDRGGLIAIQDSKNQTWLALSCYEKTDYDMAYYYFNDSTAFDCKNYIHGGAYVGKSGAQQDAVVLNGLPTGANQEYTVHLELDFVARTISFTVTDKTDPSKLVTVSDIAMDSTVAYADNVGSILFSHAFSGSGSQWTTSIDNLAVYSAGIAAEEIEYTVDCVNNLKGTGIKLVPVKGALSAEAKLNVSVLPSNASQSVTYTVSSPLADYIEVSSDGKITVKAAKQVDYDNQGSITNVSGTIRIASTQNPAVYADVKVELGPHNTNENHAAYLNGVEYSESMSAFEVGKEIQLSFTATGGDGTSDVYSYSWTVKSGSAKIENDVLVANGPGIVEIEFILDVFSGPITETLRITFTGDALPVSYVTIKFQDEEGNTIKDPVNLTVNKNGETYTVPVEYQADFKVKDSSGKTTLYKFNPGTSQVSAPYAPQMEFVLKFNNVGQYDYYEDFEDYTVNNWHEQTADVPDPTIETDHTKYLKHTTGTGTTGGYITFGPVDASGQKAKITVDVMFTRPTLATGDSQFTIGNATPSFSGNNITWGVIEGSAGHIVVLGFNKNKDFLVNGQTANTDFIGKWIHLDAEADFANKTVKITLTNDEGLSQSFDTRFFSSTVDSTIGSFYMRSAAGSGTVSVDNLTVTLTGKATTEPSITSDLNFKSVYAFGDSIVYGHNAPAQSFMRLLADDYAMDLSMYAVNGATVMPGSNDILTQVKNAPAKAPDFVVFDGYTNDAYGPKGTDTFNPNGTERDITACYGQMKGPSATTFDTSTFCGAFEQLLYTMKQKWPDSKIVFVTIHKSGARDFTIQTKLHDLTVEMCKAWGVTVVDMFGNDVSLDTRNADDMRNYIIGGTGSHPNVACCREFYIPKIVGTLEALLKGEPETPDINTAALKALIERADGLNENDHTETSWAVLQTALANAKTVLANVDATQQEIDAAAKAIEDAINALVKHADLTVLDADIATARGLKQDDYTADSWTQFQTALAEAVSAAEALRGNKNATQQEADAAVEALTAAKNALVDISALKSTIISMMPAESEKDNYTSASWTALETAVAAGRALYQSGTSTAVTKAIADIIAANTALVDISELRDILTEAKAMANAVESYSASSRTALEGVITEVEGRNLYQNGSKEAVAAAIKDIENAIARLIPVYELIITYGGKTAEWDSDWWAYVIDLPVGSTAPFYEDLDDIQVKVNDTAFNGRIVVNEGVVYGRYVINVFPDAGGSDFAFYDLVILVNGELPVDPNTVTITGVTVDGIDAEQDRGGNWTVELPYGSTIPSPDGNRIVVTVSDPTVPRNYVIISFADTDNPSGSYIITVISDTGTNVKATLTVKIAAANRTALAAALLEASELVQANYTAASWAKLQEALAEAGAVFETQAEIDAATKAIEDAIKTLVDISELRAAVTDATERMAALQQTDYTADSWEALESAIKNAQTVLADDDATQSRVNAAKSVLAGALAALVKAGETEKPDTTKLAAAIAKAEALKASDYTADSWAALQTALAAGEALLADENATQAQIDAAVAALKAALAALVEKPSSGPSGPSTPSTPGSSTASSGVTTDTTAQGGNTSTETTAKPNASVSGNSASSSVGGSMGDEIVKQTEANDSDSVVIAPDMPDNVTKADVTIPGSTLSQLGEKTDADVTVKTPAGSVTIPNEALEDLGKSGRSVTVSVENKADNTASVDVKVDGKRVEAVPGGVKAALPVKDGQVAVLVDADGNETIIQKSLVEDGTAYVMLDGSATVKFVDNSKTFDDVSASSWYSGAVTFASSHELFNGTGDGSTFSPDADMTRAMLATVLWRLESEAEAGQGAVDFADAVSGSWYADGVAWASAEGIVQGTGGNNFSPDNSITREQLATMLYRYAINRSLDTGKRANLNGYTDRASVSDWASDAMQWAVAVGLIQGKGNGVLDATGTATRAEVATILQRLVGLMVK